MSTRQATAADANGAGASAHDAEAADALGAAWELLDALPRARAAAPLAASTLEMVAADVEPVSRQDAGAGSRARPWLGPVVAVLAALGAGFVVGRATAPEADRWLLLNLPLVRHLDLLRECHSVEFLADLARTKPQPPRRLLVVSGRTDLAAEQARLADEIASLRAAGPWGDAGRTVANERRGALERLSRDERERLRAAAAEFAEFPSADRRRLEEVAAALVDPTRNDLQDAARLWRLWIAASDPLDRDEIVALDAARRQEWMKRQTRTAWPGPNPPRDPRDEGRRPPLGGRFPDGPPRDGEAPAGPPLLDRPPPDGPPPDRPSPDGPPWGRRPRRGDRPRPPDGPDGRRPPPPVSPDRPDREGPPRADAGETRATPD